MAYFERGRFRHVYQGTVNPSGFKLLMHGPISETIFTRMTGAGSPLGETTMYLSDLSVTILSCWAFSRENVSATDPVEQVNPSWVHVSCLWFLKIPLSKFKIFSLVKMKRFFFFFNPHFLCLTHKI